jgi:DNA-binding transcriptional ArsR family regulator
LEPFGQDLGELGLDGRFGLHQPLKVPAREPEHLTGFGAPDGREAGVAVAPSPVTRRELAEVVAGPERADRPGIDEDVIATGKDDVEGPVRAPPADDLVSGGYVQTYGTGADRLNGPAGTRESMVEPYQPMLAYPARGIGTLWETGPPPAPRALAALVGQTRAAMLAALAEPSSTTALAGRLSITPGAVSQHLSVLLDAGMVTRSRLGRSVFYRRTRSGFYRRTRSGDLLVAARK